MAVPPSKHVGEWNDLVTTFLSNKWCIIVGNFLDNNSIKMHGANNEVKFTYRGDGV
jgi:hypothetical protein